MLPIPQATTTLAGMAEQSQPVFNAFIPYAYLEIGIIIGVLVILFIIGIFTNTFSHLYHAFKGDGFYTQDVITGTTKYQNYK